MDNAGKDNKAEDEEEGSEESESDSDVELDYQVVNEAIAIPPIAGNWFKAAEPLFKKVNGGFMNPVWSESSEVFPTNHREFQKSERETYKSDLFVTAFGASMNKAKLEMVKQAVVACLALQNAQTQWNVRNLKVSTILLK